MAEHGVEHVFKASPLFPGIVTIVGCYNDLALLKSPIFTIFQKAFEKQDGYPPVMKTSNSFKH